MKDLINVVFCLREGGRVAYSSLSRLDTRRSIVQCYFMNIVYEY